MWKNMWNKSVKQYNKTNMCGVTCNPWGGEMGSYPHLTHVRQIYETNMWQKIYEKGCETNKWNKWKQIYETNMSWLLVNLGEKNWDPPYTITHVGIRNKLHHIISSRSRCFFDYFLVLHSIPFCINQATSTPSNRKDSS